MSSLAQRLAQIEKEIRAGRGAEAQRALESLSPAGVPRAKLAQVAALARRAGLHAAAVRLLNPVVRPLGGRASDATPRELAEYAASLTFLGAAEEAAILLRGIAEPPAEASLFEAFALFAQWDYAGAIPRLVEYLAHDSLGAYD